MSLVSAFTTAVLPILAIAAVGYVLGVATDVDVGPLNTVGLYVFIPALAFQSLVTTDLGGGEVAKLAVGVVAYAVGMVVLAGVVGRATGEEGPLLGAMMLASAVPNSGFVGIPLSGFAFGPVGRTAAVLYLTVQNVVVYTLGVYIASRESGGSNLGAVTEIFRLPLMYAVLAALVVRALGVAPPADSAFLSTVKMMGDASIPLMLVILGIQLADADVTTVSRTVTPSVLKLVVAPLVGVGLALALAFRDPTLSKVFVLECATPAGIIPLALVIEYGDRSAEGPLGAPEYLSAIIFVTTVASAVILPVLVTVLRSGLIF